MNTGRTDGIVLVSVLLLTLLMSALGAALVLLTSSEAAIAANFRDGQEARYAAEVAANRALLDLAAAGDWDRVLDGTMAPAFADGPPHGSRTLPDGSTIDLDAVEHLANCRKVFACTSTEMDAVTTERPWGPNNPRWRLWAYGWLRDAFQPPSANARVVERAGSDARYYVMVLIADDPSETDGDPSRDGRPPNPGAGVVILRARAFGAHGVRRAVELAVGRAASGNLRLLSWREMM